MRAELHPEYSEELQNLEDTFTAICRKRDSLDTEADRGADEWTSAVLRGMIVREWNKLTTALDQPYFGRVDWVECAGCSPETIYIGRQECTEANVFSWAAPLVGELYYRGTSMQSDRQRLLKRTFHLQKTTLDEIIDEFVHPHRGFLLDLPDERRDLSSEVADDLLANLLAESRDSTMRDIVRSIQEQQYRIISSSEENVLIVQGVAGSGKTAIALHRLPYLLYNNYRRKGTKKEQTKSPKKIAKAGANKAIEQDDEAEKYLFLGPNNLFLKYVASVLSVLWSSKIPQQPFDVWLLDQLGKPIKYQSQDESLEYLLDTGVPEAARQKYQRSEQLKGTTKMVILLDRYTEYIEREVLDGMKIGLSCVRQDPELIMRDEPDSYLRWECSAAEVQKVVTGSASRPLMERINMAEGYFIKRATKDIEDDIDGIVKHKSPRRTTPPLIDVTQTVRKYFAECRPAPALDQYRKLLATHSLLSEIGTGLLTNEEIDILHSESAQSSKRVSTGDLAAVVYLHSKLSGTHALRQYHHIVVDEAQDVTPMQLHVLKQYAPTASYTLVGDSAQSIFSRDTTPDWRWVADILKPVSASSTVDKPASMSALQIEQIRQSYRSTREIIEFCNKVLLRVGAQENDLAIPIARTGAVPQVVEFSSNMECAKYVQQTVTREAERGSKTIAVICKSLTNCRRFLKLWERSASTPLAMIGHRQSTYTGGVVLLPAYLAKGLEL